ncbi:MAG: hypothetical protein JXB34_12240 [Bacteroidales bacterium]|nr:hypothetical protein [Bacteroidales bacterium]
MYKFFSALLLAALSLLFAGSCNDDSFSESINDRLTFSNDTITFDTVFTTVGSVTKGFKVYNFNRKHIRISRAYIKTGQASDFRLNIDGMPGKDFENIDIAPGDSIFVFVEVTLDPVNDNNPLLVDDAVVFLCNGNTDEIVLEAFGQDVHLYNGKIIESETWTNDKPYLILNSMAIDSGEVLTIEAGTKIYLHSNSSIIVWGKLQVNGTFESPVEFTGDRFDRGYGRSSGGWETIFIHPRSRDNVINYAIIKNSVRGIQVGQPEEPVRMPSLTLNNVCISNSSFSCIFAFGAEIVANNCIFADAGYYGLVFLLGGKYNINHSTVSIVGAFSVDAGLFERYSRDAGGACVALSNRYYPHYAFDNNYVFYEKTLYNDLAEANFTNSIFYGNRDLELITDNHAEASFNYFFDHCLLKQNADSVDITDASHFRNIVLNEYPRFINDSIINGQFNFRLDTLSPAKDIGTLEILDKYPLLRYDFEGKLRTTDGKPDLGAFEREE